MASQAAIVEFLETLDMLGYLTERKGAPKLTTPEARGRLAQVWFSLLVDITDGELAAALASYLRDPDCQWYPQPGTLLAHVPGRKDANLDTSDELWGVVLSAVRSHGYYSTPSWTGPHAEAIEAGIQALGGWQHLCSTLSADNQSAERASFRSVVRTIQKRRALQTEAQAVNRIQGQHALKLLEDDDAE